MPDDSALAGADALLRRLHAKILVVTWELLDTGASVCSNNLKVRKPLAERILLRHVREDLLSEEAYQAFLLELETAIKETNPDSSRWEKALADAKKEKENLMAAIRAGIITPSTKQALEEAEAREAAAQAELDQAGDFDQEELVQQARQLWRRLVEDLGKTDDIPRIRAALQELLGEIKLFPNEN